MTSCDTPSQWWVLCCTDELTGTVVGILAHSQCELPQGPALEPRVNVGHGDSLCSQLREDSRGDVHAFPHARGTLKPPSETQMEKKGPRDTVPTLTERKRDAHRSSESKLMPC